MLCSKWNLIPPYGPSILPGENSESILERFPQTRQKFQPQAEFVAAYLGSRNVAELERLATAMFVTKKEILGGGIDERAARIHELKPHVPIDLAHEAVVDIDQLIIKAEPVMYKGFH